MLFHSWLNHLGALWGIYRIPKWKVQQPKATIMVGGIVRIFEHNILQQLISGIQKGSWPCLQARDFAGQWEMGHKQWLGTSKVRKMQTPLIRWLIARVGEELQGQLQTLCCGVYLLLKFSLGWVRVPLIPPHSAPLQINFPP